MDGTQDSAPPLVLSDEAEACTVSAGRPSGWGPRLQPLPTTTFPQEKAG